MDIKELERRVSEWEARVEEINDVLEAHAEEMDVETRRSLAAEAEALRKAAADVNSILAQHRLDERFAGFEG